MSILVVTGLSKYYGKEASLVKALDDVSFHIDKGSFTTIIGTSGSGKSTLLNLIGGLDKPTAGSIVVDGSKLIEMSQDELTLYRRRKVGFVFQDFNLVPVLNVYENIILPLTLDRKKVETEYIDDILTMLAIKDKTNQVPGVLSGGQQQRVAIARALAAKPAIILADEPTGNLDSKTSQDVLDLLKKSAKRYDQTVVMITHDKEISNISDAVIQIEDGKIG